MSADFPFLVRQFETHELSPHLNLLLQLNTGFCLEYFSETPSILHKSRLLLPCLRTRVPHFFSCLYISTSENIPGLLQALSIYVLMCNRAHGRLLRADDLRYVYAPSCETNGIGSPPRALLSKERA